MFQPLLSLFLESNCFLCDRAAKDPLCEFCQGKLQQCRLKNSRQYWRGELPLFVWGVYGGYLKRAIAALKYNACRSLGEFLGYWLGKAWIDASLLAKVRLTVVPIPLHYHKHQTRGFNQAELIARSFCEYTGYALQPNALQRVRETEAMFGLSRLQREQNLKDAFSVSKSFQQRRSPSPILLLDDIYTTGTTVREAARVLHNRGNKVLGVVTLSAAI